MFITSNALVNIVVDQALPEFLISRNKFLTPQQGLSDLISNTEEIVFP